jgi:hypothetical protein
MRAVSEMSPLFPKYRTTNKLVASHVAIHSRNAYVLRLIEEGHPRIAGPFPSLLIWIFGGEHFLLVGVVECGGLRTARTRYSILDT